MRDRDDQSQLMARFPRRTVEATLSPGGLAPMIMEGLVACRDTIGFTARGTIRVVGPGASRADAAIDDSTDVEPFSSQALPTVFAFHRPAPTPARGGCDLAFDLPSASPVRVRIFDVHGRLVSSVLDRTMPAGSHRVRWDAAGAPAGLYFVRLEAGSFTAAHRLVLVP